MNETLTRLHGKYKGVIYGILVVLVGYAVLQIAVQYKLKSLTTTLESQITEQQKLLISIAETTSRNGADAITESIVKDCNVNERTEFDALLGKLNQGLSKAELTNLERLFGRCGSFYAQRKTVMVARLNREIEIYKNYIEQLQVLTNEKTVEKYSVDSWNQLGVDEKKQSELFSKLAVLQDDIISNLLTGKSPASEEIKAILLQVEETQGMLIITRKQIETVRAGLTPS